MGKAFLTAVFLMAFWPQYLLAQAGKSRDFFISTVNHVCYGSNEVNRVYIPPPESIRMSKGGAASDIEVIYFGFPDSARIAFDYAVDVWASLVPSSVKIRIRATWTSMSEPGILGSAGATSYFRGSFIDAPQPDVYYSAALAEKIAGRELNDASDYEITVRFNSAAAWYFGVDGATPATRYDLVTVVIHELCHGLGFADSFNSDDINGSYGLNGLPVIYDTFVEDVFGKKLTNTAFYTNPSAALKTALTSNSLYFAAPVTLKYTSGIKPLLYAPGTWDSGSSVSHLSESGTLQINALMTPFIGKGEAIHNPGLLTMSMMSDLGWINTKIDHTPVADTESAVSSVDLAIGINSDTLIKRNGVRLIVKHGDALPFDTVTFDFQGRSGVINHTLPVPGYNTLTSYYIAVSDTFGRVYYAPSKGLGQPYTFFVGEDTVNPVIVHDQFKFILSTLDTFDVRAVISDNLYPVNALVEYRLNNGTPLQVPMLPGGDNKFTGYIPMDDFTYTGTDTLFYRIIANDEALNTNTSVAPSAGFFKLPVYALFDPVEYYFTAFNEGGGDFLLDGFTVSRPTGFLNPGLHTRHPYESKEDLGGSIEYTAMLRYPITIDESGLYLSFKEVVLVEPGEEGALFGTDDFYDYVVTEASKDGGRTWTPLANGYDSRADLSWEQAYNSSILDNNSTFTGKPELFIKRTISLDNSGFLNQGDNVVIRFRLFSDPFANGWGWALDDLFIKGLASSVESPQDAEFRIYPNPGSGRFAILSDEAVAQAGYTLKIIDYTGRIVKTVRGVTDRLYNVDISNLTSGIYSVVIELAGRRTSVRYILTR
ncbi:MAG: T9SS type A sorting domain-containing protein [Bacteroidales bacterium]|nr:T9SS type A sorting domain-containing protein [Bacteroidales bacterium]